MWGTPVIRWYSGLHYDHRLVLTGTVLGGNLGDFSCNCMYLECSGTSLERIWDEYGDVYRRNVG